MKKTQQWTLIRRPKIKGSPQMDGGAYGVQAGKFRVLLHWDGVATQKEMSAVLNRIVGQAPGDIRKERLLTKEVTKRGRAWMRLAKQRLEHIKALRLALVPFANFGIRLMDGRSHVPPSGAWYGLDVGEPTEATLDIEHFKLAMSLTDSINLEPRPSKGRTLKRKAEAPAPQVQSNMSGWDRSVEAGINIGPAGNTD